MRVLVLHPPMYPVNYDFYNFLGQYVELTIFQIGEYPHDHKEWNVSTLKNKAKNFNLKVFGNGTNSFKNQIKSLQISEIHLIKPDIVLSIAFWIPSFYYSFLSIVLNFKFIILTNAIEATEVKYSFLRNFYRKTICRNTDLFISASNLTTKYLRKLCPNNKIELSIQTIEVEKWRKSFLALESKQRLRKKFKIPKSKVVILGVGNFYYKKNWLMAIRSLKKIKNVLFLLIGDGIDKDIYNEYIKVNSMDKKVWIIDRKDGDDLKEYFKASDAFLLPSIMETFGFVVVEALTSDLPVLCSKYAGASTLVKNGYNGYVIDSKHEFSADIEKIIINMKKLSENAYKSIDNLTLENRAKEFFNIFNMELS